jgi:hypothetical protein
MKELELLSSTLDTLVKYNIVQSASEYDSIKLSIQINLKRNCDNAVKIMHFDIELMSNNMSREEHIEEKRKLLCHEPPVNDYIDKLTRDNLLKDEILNENDSGVYFPEPYSQVALNLIANRDRNVLGAMSDKLKALFNVMNPHIVTHYSNRTRMANRIGELVNAEDAIIFSGTPSIFDPFEPNDTEIFRYFLKGTRKNVIYCWDKEFVFNKIKDDLSERITNETILKDKYISHFKEFAQIQNLMFFCIDNKTICKSWDKLPCITKTKYVEGERSTDRKLKSGRQINISKLANILSLAPYVKTAKTIFEKEEGLLVDDYAVYRNDLLALNNTIRLIKHDESSIVEYVDKIFYEALAK